MISAQVETPFIGIWDADIILSPGQIIKAVEQLRLGTFDVAYPYDGIFLDTSYILRNHFLQHRDISFLNRNKAKMLSLYSSQDWADAVGGGFLVNTEKYKYAGRENELFYGWGPEDGERYCRWKILGFRIFRSKGCLFHLSHPRDMNGGKGIPDLIRENNGNSLTFVSNLTKQELEDFIQSNQ